MYEMQPDIAPTAGALHKRCALKLRHDANLLVLSGSSSTAGGPCRGILVNMLQETYQGFR